MARVDTQLLQHKAVAPAVPGRMANKQGDERRVYQPAVGPDESKSLFRSNYSSSLDLNILLLFPASNQGLLLTAI